MREIKFRAKRVDNGEWVYGSLIVLDRGFYIVDTNHYNTISADLHEKLEINALWEDNDFKRVSENTICQFTGLYDKNGTKIFEGDIVKTKYQTLIVKYGFTKIQCCGCCYRYHDYIGFYFENDNCVDMYEEITKEIEVIGNIYDNPELLKGE